MNVNDDRETHGDSDNGPKRCASCGQRFHVIDTEKAMFGLGALLVLVGVVVVVWDAIQGRGSPTALVWVGAGLMGCGYWMAANSLWALRCRTLVIAQDTLHRAMETSDNIHHRIDDLHRGGYEPDKYRRK